MSDGRVHIRRGRRTDFTAVMALLAASGVAVPVPDRATLRRWRQLVADLGGDLYLALVDDAVVGLVHVTYARQLATPPSARLDQLVVAPSVRRRGIGSALLAFVERRARQRGCRTFTCVVPDADAAVRAFLDKAGTAADAQRFSKPLRD
ncbi:MAG TPA: GNAT family N-acetyltransferase [Candidatus Margulisiibacteriota bacterium]|nr:GNAT family N-acetyltransferase [Candidatus Margulisiibacteriota bacterium]